MIHRDAKYSCPEFENELHQKLVLMEKSNELEEQIEWIKSYKLQHFK